MLWQLPLLRLSPPGFFPDPGEAGGIRAACPSGVSAERSPREGLGSGRGCGRGSWARYLRLRQWGPPFRGCAGRGSMGILMTEGGGNWGRNGEIPGEGSAWRALRAPGAPKGTRNLQRRRWRRRLCLPLAKSQGRGLGNEALSDGCRALNRGVWPLLSEDCFFFAMIFQLSGHSSEPPASP